MAIRSLLVPLIGPMPPRAPLDMAAGLARRYDAFVEVFHPALDPILSAAYLGEGATGPLIDNVVSVTEQEAEERIRQARAIYDAAGFGSSQSVRSAFLVERGQEEELVAARARLNDLCLMPRLGGVSTHQGTLESVLYGSGRAVLVVPPEGTATPGEGTAIVAWNDSPEASRALALGMPLLQSASRVVVVAVGDVPLGGVVDYLERHEIAASARQLEKQAHSMLDDPAGDLILRACTSEKADLLVMGAYTHSRLRRMIMGGATRKVLFSASIPVLMAH